MADVQLSVAANPWIVRHAGIPRQVLKDDIPNELRSAFFDGLDRIDEFYRIYERGVGFAPEGSKGDYVPSTLYYKKCRKLIDDEARFMFSNTPDIRIDGIDAENSDELKRKLSEMNKFLSEVLKKNFFASKLIKAAKDCFIAGRVCLIANFNDGGIQVDFINALEFYYEFSEQQLSKLAVFYQLNNSLSKTYQRIKKKVYELRGEICWVSESLYDGVGKIIEQPEEFNTGFSFIPAVVIFNDGLTGNTTGESEIDIIDDFESYYSKLANADKDTLRKSMNAIKYVIDGTEESTRGLGTGPGAIWDIQSDIDLAEGKKASVGQLEPSMGYKDALQATLDRVENGMYGLLSMPNITSEHLQGLITSGKTLRALYWPTVVRCGEKEHTWTAAIEKIIDIIFDGSFLVPGAAKQYTDGQLENVLYRAIVETNYALPGDEGEEKSLDLQEVNSMVMSRKAYMIKWRGLTEKEADAELHQILLEKQLLEDSAFDLNAFGEATTGKGSEAKGTNKGATEADRQLQENADVLDDQKWLE